MKKEGSDHTMDMSEGDFGSMCRRIDDNDPDVLRVTLGEPGLTPIKAIQLGGCLEGNTVVDTLVIDFAFVKVFCGSIFSFVKFVEKSKSLRSVVLINAELTDLKICSALLVLLPGVAKNSGISTFEMRSGQTVYRNIFVALWYAIMHALFGGSATISTLQTSVALSLSQCQSLESLVLEYLPESFNCQILPELGQFHSLTSLMFVPRDYSLETLDAMTSLVRSSMSLETLQLEGFQFNSSNFTSLAEGLVESMSVKDLTFSKCAFKSTSTQMVQDVATTMKKVTIGPDVKFSRSTSAVLVDIVSQTEDSTLKKLDLSSCPLQGKHLTRFLTGIEESTSSTLESLSLPSASKPSDLNAIKDAVSSMPSLKEMNIANLDVEPHQQKELVAALKENLGLISCNFNGEEIILNRPKEKSFSFKVPNNGRSRRRSKNLRKTLSAKEIHEINAKDEYLQRQNSLKEQQGAPSDSDESNAMSHREKMMETMQRHRLSDRVLDVLNDSN